MEKKKGGILKKLKKFYHENRIYCILMIISFVCLLIMGTGIVVYFINQSLGNQYGNRLDEIKEYDCKKDIEALETYFKDSKNVNDYTVRQQGRIIYITLDVKPEESNEDIQNLATTSLDNVSDNNKSYYDIQFMVTRGEDVAYSGSKSSSNTIITWANYNIDAVEDTSEE